jgi:hypothetical protein
MGSWANSFHVRSDDPASVLDAIRTLLLESGYRLPDETPAPRTGQSRRRRGRPRTLGSPFSNRPDEDDDDFDHGDDDFGEDGDGQRRLCVHRPVNGWVGVLDSEPFSDLTHQLSSRLRTDTLAVMVNDSDSWLYGMFRKGQPFDEFDSSGEEGGDGEDGDIPPELQRALERGDQRAVDEIIERELLARAPSSPIYYPFGGIAPPVEMAFLRQRIREGRATFGDRLRYLWMWLRYRFQVLLSFFGRRPMEFGYDSPRATPLDDDTLNRHVAQIRDFFPDADAGELRRLLPLNRFPSEELLADFLEVVGLPRFYAYLSYRYLEEHSEEELAAEGIVRVGERRFLSP